MAQDFEAAKLRQSALAMQLEVQRSELQVLREKQKRHEEIVIQEQDRHLVSGCVYKKKLGTCTKHIPIYDKYYIAKNPDWGKMMTVRFWDVLGHPMIRQNHTFGLRFSS